MVPHLPKTYLDGAAILLPDGNPVIGLTLRYDRIDYFWFCLLHELAHVSKHLSESHRLIIDDLDLRRKKVETEDAIEKEADEMTRNGLIPKRIWAKKPISGKASTEEVCALAEKLKIHPAIIAGRIRFEQNNYKLLSGCIGNKQIRKHFADIFFADASQQRTLSLYAKEDRLNRHNFRFHVASLRLAYLFWPKSINKEKHRVFTKLIFLDKTLAKEKNPMC